MSKQLRMKMKRAIAGIVMITTIVWLSGVMALVPVANAATIVDGDVIKNPSAAGLAQFDVYIVKLVGTKKFKRLVLNPQVFDSYGHLSWSNVKSVDQATMDSYSTSGLVRVDGDAAQKVYALAPSGDTGSKSWVNVTATQFVTDAGADSDSVYTINSTDAGNYTAVADITTVNDVKTFLTAGTLPSTTPVVTGQFTVALASDNPAATNVIADSTGNKYPQALIPFAKVNFTASSSADVKVTTVKFTRTGIASDADLGNLYLYDGSTKVADYNSLSTKVATFSNSAGLFTVAKGTTKSLTLKGDLARASTSVGAGKTIGFNIAAATDVTTDGATVSGTFPLTGNFMTTAAVSDLGHLYFSGASGSNGTYPSTVKADEANKQLWSVNVTADAQNMQIKSLKFTMVGTIATTDIKNIRLEVAGVQVGTATTIAADNTVVFDLSAAPIAINSGVTKSIALRGDMAGGSGRVFKFTIQKSSDVSLYDTNYGVYVTPNVNSTSTAFGIVQGTTGNGTSVEAGTITVGVASDSPTGNIADAATAITFAKFSFTASGEAVKVDSLRVKAAGTGSNEVLANVKVLLDGSQIGTTDTALTADNGTDYTDFTFGNSFIIPAGSTKYITVVADTTGANIAAADQITVSLVSVSGNATGQTTLTSLTTTAQAGRTLTVQSGSPVVTLNTAVADKNATNPTGVANASGVKIASFVITAGSGEAIDVSQIVVGDKDGTTPLGEDFQNLKLMNGTTQIGTTVGTLNSSATASTYTFTPASNIRIAAGQGYVVDVYADVKSSVTNSAAALSPVALFTSLAATGVSTGASANATAGSGGSITNLQIAYLAAKGSLAVTANAATPVAGQLVMGDTDVTLAQLDFAAGSAENVNITRIKITDTTSFGGSLSNIKLYDGTTLLGTVASLDATSNGAAEFVLASNWTIPASVTKTLTVKGSVNAWPNATSGGSHTVNLAANTDIDTIGASSGSAIDSTDEVVTSATGTEQDVYRTKVVVDRASSSPSGTATAGAGASVLEFNVVANSAYDAVLNAVAVTMSGSVDMTSTGDAKLYKSTDTVTALATEAYVTGTADGAGSTTTLVLSTGWAGIPVGANVRVYDATAAAYMTTGTHKVTAITTAPGTTLTVTPAMSAAGAASDIVYYRPLQPGTGKIYFGAQTTLGADVATGATSLTVTSTNGFSVGDTVTVKGYSAAGVEVTSTAGGVITAIPDATTLTVTAVTVSATIDYNYLSATAANAIAKNQNSAAVAYTGVINETISAGTTKTFVVKGDTTGATSTETLRADIAAVGDLNWKDKVHYGVTTLTKNLSITGGTLSY